MDLLFYETNHRKERNDGKDTPLTVTEQHMDIYARVKYNKPEQLVDVVNSAFHQAVPS